MLKTLVIFVALYWLSACALQRKLIFPGSFANRALGIAGDIDKALPGLERGQVKTDAGSTEFWYRKAPAANADNPAGLIVFAHGNSELIDGQSWVFAGFEKLGYSVAMCEYRGYGSSNGSPSQAAITSDTKAMVEHLLKRPEVDAKRLVYMGRSIGTGIACSLANEIEPAAIILISPLESMARMAWGMFIPSIFVLDDFDNKGTLEAFEGPVLLMHGTRDTTIPFDHSRVLHEAAKDSQLESFDCGHNNFPVQGTRVWSLMKEFLEREVGE